MLHAPRVLLVEDNADIRKAQAIVMCAEGYSVTER